MKSFLVALLSLLVASVASAQGVTVIGPITPGDCAQFNSTTVVKDAGFNCAGAPGNAITALSGDATATGPGSVPVTLATVLGTPGTFGSATSCISATVNAKGLVTAISAATCTPAIGSVTGLGTNWQTALAAALGSGWTSALNAALGTGVGTALGTNINASGGIITPTPTRAGDVLYWNGSAWTTLPGNNSGTLILSENPSGVPAWTAAGAGSVQSVTCNGLTFTVTGSCPPKFGFSNCSITASVASNNLTVALKDNSGADPTATSPCAVYFRNAILATGSWSLVTQTAALSFTANSGSSFGSTNTTATCRAASSCPFKLWVVLLNVSGSLALGVVDLTNASGVDPLNEQTLLTTTACNACATANTIGTVYSTAAQTSVPFAIIGYLEWGSGLATAGTWASAPTAIQTLGPGVRRPGEVIQSQVCCVGNVTTVSPTGTTFAGGLNTNVTATITPTMSSNLVRFSFTNSAINSTINDQVLCQMGFSPTPTAVGPISKGNTSQPFTLSASGYDTPGGTSAITYTERCWVNAGTGTIPAANTDSAFEELLEIMG